MMRVGITCSRAGRCDIENCYSSVNSCVEDSEMILRMIFLPYHVRSGRITVGAFSSKQLLEFGVSVNRKIMLTQEMYSNVVQRIDCNENRILFGIAQLNAEKVRYISELMICPSGNHDDPSHADIFAQNERLEKEDIDQIRRDLVEICNLMSEDEVFNS